MPPLSRANAIAPAPSAARCTPDHHGRHRRCGWEITPDGEMPCHSGPGGQESLAGTGPTHTKALAEAIRQDRPSLLSIPDFEPHRTPMKLTGRYRLCTSQEPVNARHISHGFQRQLPRPVPSIRQPNQLMGQGARQSIERHPLAPRARSDHSDRPCRHWAFGAECHRHEYSHLQNVTICIHPCQEGQSPDACEQILYLSTEN